MSEIIDEAKRLLAALDEDTSRTAQLRVLSHALAEARSKPRDWPAFWQSLTDAEAAAALRAAPDVAEPWEDGDSYCRRGAIDGYGHAAECGCNRGPDGDLAWWWGWRMPDGAWHEEESWMPSKAEARAACDSALRASGWRVL